jgi:hypothetical protein
MAPGKPKTERDVVFWGGANHSSQGDQVLAEPLNGMFRFLMTNDNGPYVDATAHGRESVVSH